MLAINPSRSRDGGHGGPAAEAGPGAAGGRSQCLVQWLWKEASVVAMSMLTVGSLPDRAAVATPWPQSGPGLATGGGPWPEQGRG